MVYKSLLLSAGGGVRILGQQVDQARDVGSLLIGLGGTGIDCLRTIKTQVYDRIRPDDPGAPVPEYSHIRFLGVDSDRGAWRQDPDVSDDGTLPLDEAEVFQLVDRGTASHLKEVIENHGIEGPYAWLSPLPIPHFHPFEILNSGIRQVGRFELMEKSDAFMARLATGMRGACSDLASRKVCVHVFAGLCGGTGSGTFLDVCYMVREAARHVGVEAMVFGYFFMPDVALSKVPAGHLSMRDHLAANGYAAMQELDWCMGLPENGGSFVQEYEGGMRIAWDRPPVDMCHLVSASNAGGGIVQDAYGRSIRVVAEHIVDLLCNDSAFGGAVRKLWDFLTAVYRATQMRDVGANLAYCAIGASCASLPLRQMNTYTMAMLFEGFATAGRKVPTHRDVEDLAARSFAKNGDSFARAYDSLWAEITEGVGGFVPWPGTWREARDHGNDDIELHYSSQEADMLERVEANARGMKDVGNPDSLIGRLWSELESVARDIDRGPVFALGMLVASTNHSLTNLIDALICENHARWDVEAFQTKLRNEDYRRAWHEFDAKERPLFPGGKRLFEEFKNRLRLLREHDLLMGAYQALDGVLQKLRQWVEDEVAPSYAILARVTNSLIQTFEENRLILDSGVNNSSDGFELPIVSIEGLMPALDNELSRIDVRGAFEWLMGRFLNNESEWLGEDETKVARLVTSFFVDGILSDFWRRPLASLLEDEYKVTDHDELVRLVYDRVVGPLTERARPLLHFDPRVPLYGTDGLSSNPISVPAMSAVMGEAADRKVAEDSHWCRHDAAATDRLTAYSLVARFPMYAYGGTAELEHAYHGTAAPGRHLYSSPALQAVVFDCVEEVKEEVKIANDYLYLATLNSRLTMFDPPESDARTEPPQSFSASVEARESL